MSEEYSVVDYHDVEPTVNPKSATRRVNLVEELGCTEMRPKVWLLEPGNDSKNYHRHSEQEELYVVLSGPGRMTVAGDTLTVPEGGAVRVPPETPRRTFNDTDEEHAWLVVGAPNVDDAGEVIEEPR